MRGGFHRFELALVVAVVVLTTGLSLPAIRAAQAEADRTRCQDHLRRLGQGFLAFEKVHGGLPPRRSGFNNGAPYGGWGAYLLPHIGDDALAKKYNPKLDFFDPGNKAAVESPAPVFLCPASPGNRRLKIQSQASTKSENPDKDTVHTADCGVTDFISSNGLLMPRGGYGLNALVADQMSGNQRQPMVDNEFLPLRKITDGTSCTLLLIEQAGRPDVWRKGKKKEGEGQFGMSANARGAWAGWGSIAFGPASAATGETPGRGDATDCTVNCNNWFGLYSFHPGGANVLLCDGSVRFLNPTLDPLTLAYLTLRDDGHLIAADDF